MEKKDTLVLGGHEFTSRFILGSGKFSVDLIKAAVEQGGAQMVTMALRRVEAGQKDNILDYIPKDVTLLPNTSSARNADEAVRIAHLSREVGCGDFIKIEVMRDSKYLLPDNNETIKATEILAKEGFVVLPYMYPDLYAARALADAGAAAIMPLASPIGTNKGLSTKDFIQILIDETFIMSQIQIGLRAVVRHVAFSMLIRIQRSRIDVDVGIEFLYGYPKSSGLKKFGQRCGNDAFSQGGSHTASNENILCTHILFCTLLDYKFMSKK